MDAARIASITAAFALLLAITAPVSENEASADPARESVQHKSAAVAVATTAAAAPPHAVDDAATACPEGMVEVEGEYCPLLEQKCKRWLDPEETTPLRCAEFEPSGACQTKTVHKRFCIDRFEYPNARGATPVVMKTWTEARDVCQGHGKRLCGGSEWTLACEGQQRLPYPYGLKRSSEACNIDKPRPLANEKALTDPKTRDAEVARLWQGEPSGTRASCASSYGVFDLTGNVDEWVRSENGAPFSSALKGGYWGPVRDRCRSTTGAHGEDFAFYQIGFRCCRDIPRGAVAAR